MRLCKMPKTAFDYKNSIIYKICCKDHNIKDIYIGSTTNMVKRRHGHKFNCNNENRRHHNLYVYQFIRDHGGWNNWDMVLVEKYPCLDKMELQQRERYWYDELKPSLNTQRPYISNEERRMEKIQYDHNYRNENRDRKNENDKKYYWENRERRNKKFDCVCGGKYTHQHKVTHNKTKKHRLYLEKQQHLNSFKIGEI